MVRERILTLLSLLDLVNLELDKPLKAKREHPPDGLTAGGDLHYNFSINLDLNIEIRR
jgi:hypothetical protein